MNIRIEKNRILQPLNKLVGITEKRSVMPILANILFAVDREKTEVFCTDLELSGIARLDFGGDYEQRLVIHGRKFVDILREMDNEEVDLSIEGNSLSLRQKRTEFVIALQDPEEYPEVKEITGKEGFIIEGKTLLGMIEKVVFAVSTDEARHVLTGMFLEGKEGKLKVVGTDGFRMALYERSIEGLRDFKGVIIPKRSVVEIGKMFEEEEKVRVTMDDKHIQFAGERMFLISRLMEGNFPDYEHVVPVNKNVAVVDREAFIKGLRKVSAILGRAEPVRMLFRKGSCEIDAESDVGRAKEILEIDYDGEELAMNFNVRFLLDVAQHNDGANMAIKAPSAYGAVLVEGGEENSYKNIIMPIRV